MPSDGYGFRMPFATFRRPVSTISRDPLNSELSNSSNIPSLDLFEKNVSTRFHDLSIAKSDEFLSVSWIRKLLDVYTGCQDDFLLIIGENRTLLSKAPTDKLANEFFDKSVKAMDIFNATRDGIETVRQWQKHLEIILCALDSRQKLIGEGQIRRARKALTDLALVMFDEKDTGSVSVFSHRNRSFVRKGKSQSQLPAGHARSMSWSVSHTWSASKQLQSIANNLVVPRSHEVAASNGLAILVFSMSFILMFVLWALVAAIPCQDRGVQINFVIPRQFSWSTPLFLIHSRIMGESKKRDRRNSNGLLKEVCEIEKHVHQVTGLVDAAQLPLSEEQKEELRENVQGLSSVCVACNDGLDPLERQLREVFRKIMHCRMEGLEFIGKGTTS